VLVPRLPLLDLPGVSLADPAGLARAGDHLILRVGAWTFWLALDATGRFPTAEDAIPRERGGSRLRLDPRDAALLVATLPKLPGRDDEFAPVTLDLGTPPAAIASEVLSGRYHSGLPHKRMQNDVVRVIDTARAVSAPVPFTSLLQAAYTSALHSRSATGDHMDVARWMADNAGVQFGDATT